MTIVSSTPLKPIEPAEQRCDNPFCDCVLPEAQILRSVIGRPGNRKLKVVALCDVCSTLMTKEYVESGGDWLQVGGTVEKNPSRKSPTLKQIAQRMGELQINSL